MNTNTIITIVVVLLVIVVAALAALTYFGRKLETKQVEQKQAMELNKQTLTMLVIDKKKMKIKDSGLPKIVYEQTPKYLRWSKVPIVKAKVGPKILTLMADEKVFQMIPIKTEVKATVSGIYISEIKSVRGKNLPQTPVKTGFFQRMFHRKKETA